jgi:hydrogenase expression/formation protein HypC
MCLAIPGKLIELFEDHGLRMGRVDYGGTRASACLATVPEAQVGQYVVVHAGFAISVLDEEQARRSLELLGEMARAAAAEASERSASPSDAGAPAGRAEKP